MKRFILGAVLACGMWSAVYGETIKGSVVDARGEAMPFVTNIRRLKNIIC